MPDPIATAPPPEGAAPQAPSIRASLAYVYVGYAFRYLYLLILIPFYGRVLGAHEYGRVLAAMSLFQIVWMLGEYGFPVTGSRDAAAARTPDALARVYGQHLHGRLIAGLPALLVGIGGTWLSPVLREQPLFGLLATLNGLIAAFNLGWMFQGMLRFRTSVALEVLGFAISLPLILALVHAPQDGAWVLASLVISSAICTAMAHGIVLRALQGAVVPVAGGLRLLIDSTALFVNRGLGMLTANASTYLLSLTASPTQVGWYGAAERLSSVGLSLLMPASQVLTGTINQHLGDTDGEARAMALMRKTLRWMTAFGLCLLLGTLLLAHWAVPLVMGPDFNPSVPMLYIMALSFPLVAYAQVVTGQVLIPMRRDMAVTRTGVIASVVTIALIAIGAYTLGGTGVAIARTVGALVLVVLLVITLRSIGLFKAIHAR